MEVRTTYDELNLQKNGITHEEIEQVFQSDLTFAEEMDPSERGNDRAMIIGWTHDGRLLEVGIEYFEKEEREHVFHAMDAGRAYRKQFERRLGDGGSR